MTSDTHARAARSPLASAPRGPHAVGIAETTLADASAPGRSLAVDVWYPAASTDEAQPASHPLGQPHEAYLDAAPAPGPVPLVAFSHGNSGLRRQSTFLTTHLASWGFAVAAPDHTGNTFFEMARIDDPDERIRAHKEARRNRPDDLAAVIDAVVAPASGDRARWPEIDAGRVGVLGHSYGGWTACKMPAKDARVRAVCGLAPVSEPFVGKKAFAPGELPFARKIPTLLVAGLDDVLVELDQSVETLYSRLDEPRALVGISGADHFHFCDGIEPLHRMHERNVRPRQKRPTRPYAELLPQDRMHRLVSALVTHFFAVALCAGPAGQRLGEFGEAELAELDPGLVRLEPSPRSAS